MKYKEYQPRHEKATNRALPAVDWRAAVEGEASGYESGCRAERGWLVRPGGLGQLVHLGEEVLVRLGHFELVQQELHGLDGVELAQRLPQEPHLLKLVLLQEELLLPGAALLDVDGGEDPLVHEAPVQV